MDYTKKTLQTLLFVFCSFGTVAQSNTPCGGGGAPALPVTSSCSYTSSTTVGATAQTNTNNFGSPSCGVMGNDVWYSFTAPASGNVTIGTQAGSITDGVMALYESDCAGSFSSLACSDDVVGLMPEITESGLTPGQTYYIRFWEWGGGTGTFGVCVVDNGGGGGGGSAPANDDCAGATSLTVNSSCSATNWSIDPSYSNSVSPATACSQNGSIEDAWFSFTATSTNTTVDVENFNRRMLFALYDGNCGSLNQLSCIDAVAGSGVETITYGTTIGVTYYIQVVRTNGDGSTNSMSGDICVYNAAAPTCNDGIQNQGETGIDCGGPCPACVGNSCPSLGFDDVTNAFTGNHSVWSTYRARNNVPGAYTIEGPIVAEPINNNQFSSYADIRPGNNPSGSWCYYANGSIAVPNSSASVMRLGAFQEAFSEAHGMEATITITEPYLRYYYLLGFENTGHTINNRGFCTFRIRDNGGAVLPCGSFDVYENGPNESWTYDNSSNAVWLMDSWRTVTVDVSSYIGQDLTIEVWVADCQEGAHSGFGYFDFECLSTGTPDCSVTPLPVEFSGVSVDCIHGEPFLLWTTNSESNNEYFSVNYSRDGQDFQEITKISAVGNSQSTSDYMFEIPQDYRNGYFQISQTDVDGSEEFFEPIAYQECQGMHTDLKSFVDDANNIHIVGENMRRVRLVDMTGRIIVAKDVNKDHFVLKNLRLSQGNYMIQVEYNDNNLETQKLYMGVSL